MRIGIYGGSFNPIHKGHIAIAKELLSTKHVDQIWFLVSPHNPLKEQTDLWDDNLRLKLAQLALNAHPNMQASDFEFHLPRPSFMWNTLQQLSSAYPQHTFILLIGADNWLCFNKWHKWENILQNYELGIYPRPGYEIDITSLPSNVRYFSTGLYNISSTEIRKRLANKEDVSDLVPPEILEELR